MGVHMSGTYAGSLRVTLTHESGASFNTSAPKDNNGDGLSFSPTDLVVASLSSCILTTMAMKADKDGYDFSGTHFTAEKIMSQEPRRVGEIRMLFHLPAALPEAQRPKYERIAELCPVHKSLHPDIRITSNFVYDA